MKQQDYKSRSGRSKSRIDFEEINREAMSRLPSLLPHMLPGGIRRGNEYVALNPTRDDRRLGSFKINICTGKWADFATGDKGGDIVSLYAYLVEVRQSEAVRMLARMFGVR